MPARWVPVRWLLPVRWMVPAAIALCSVACSEAPQHKVERTLTSTVTLTLEDTLQVESAVPLKVHGERRIDEIYSTLKATVTASTSTRAEAAADELEIRMERRDRVVFLQVIAPKDTTLEGELSIRAPADLKVDLTEHGGTVDVLEMDEDIRVASVSHVRVVGGKADVVIGVVTGNALVDTELNPGSNVEIFIQGSGDVELSVPTVISADLQALIRMSGTVIPNHPQLPPYLLRPGQTYQAVVGGGLSTVALSTNVGNIVIRTR